MTPIVFDTLRTLVGTERVERDGTGRPRVSPTSAAAIAQICQVCKEQGWRMRVVGNGSWQPDDAPADLTLTTAAMSGCTRLSPPDLTATVESGIPFDVLQRDLTLAGAWIPLDPPGHPHRTIGSILATATHGPLTHHSIRHTVLGCTVVTGDGRIVKAGGAVVKNVAGYDLTKLQIGGFGGFGIIVEVHLRLAATPRADSTFVLHGSRDSLLAAGQAILAAEIDLAAIELCSPGVGTQNDWALALRLMGSIPAVEAESKTLRAVAGPNCIALSEPDAAQCWAAVARGPIGQPTCFRLGTLLPGIPPSLTLLTDHVGDGVLTVGLGSGLIRWAGDATSQSLGALRGALAEREVPMTIERAPWEVRWRVGHFGACREGVGHLVEALRQTYDPCTSLMVPLHGDDSS